jgi:hypothetical protein
MNWGEDFLWDLENVIVDSPEDMHSRLREVLALAFRTDKQFLYKVGMAAIRAAEECIRLGNRRAATSIVHCLEELN